MNFWEGFNKNYSRKAAVAVLAIAALAWIANSLIEKAVADGSEFSAVKWPLIITIVVIGLIAETSIIFQGAIDYKYGREKEKLAPPATPENQEQ